MNVAKSKKAKAKKPKKVKAKRAKKPKAPAEVQKQRADVYTMMLIVSFLMLTLGSVLLYLENEKYKWDTQADEYDPSASISTPAMLVASHGADLDMPRLV